MKILIVAFIFIFLANCSKQKTVLICGDHICVNKAEAEKYFEENLSIEVKLSKKKIKPDLVELNLNNNSMNKKLDYLRKKQIKIKKLLKMKY